MIGKRFNTRSSINVLMHCSRLALMRSLLTPYENRPWAQTNWILVQMWKVMPVLHIKHDFCQTTYCLALRSVK